MLAAGALGLWSCSSDDAAMPDPGKGASGAGETVFLTVTASREGDAATRTIMSPDEEGNNLNCAWTDGDKLLVTDASGVRRGVLTLAEDCIGKADGTFTGEVSIEGITKDDAGKAELNFLYLGTSRNAMEDASSVVEGWDDASNTYTAYYAAQPGTLLSLTEQDLLTATKKVTLISGNADKSPIYVEKFMMNRRISFAKFKLIMPENVYLNSGAQVTITGTGLKTCAKVSFAAEAATEEGRIVVKYDKSEPNTKGYVSGDDYDEEGTVSGSASATVVVKPKSGKVIVPVGSDGSFYMVLLPNGLTGDNAKFDLNFEVTASNGTIYKGTYNVTKEIEEGKYYRKQLSDEGNISYDGIPVDMDSEKQNVDYPGYENEDPNNPLHKWAKYNLERKDGVINGFVGSETENGALYQWGRNYGYMDKSGTYPGSNVSIGGDFTNYFEAMGDFEWYDELDKLSTSESKHYYRVYDYYVYTKSGGIWSSGTGLKGYSNGYEYWCTIDNFRSYSKIEDLTSRQDKFFINQGEGTSDYWLSGFGNGGSDWESRAKLCGYERTNPCPDKWRLPSEADFKEICPSDMPSYQGNLSTLITEKAKPELRETGDGTKYVIRWLNYTGYLKIEAIVVDNSFKESDIQAIVWDNNSKVVTRLFPFTGNISSMTAPDTRLTEYFGQQVTLVIPYTLGKIKQAAMEEGDLYGFILGYSPFYYPWTLFTPNPDKNYGSALGGYWAKEKILFSFEDSDKAGGQLTSSCITIGTGSPESAYAIRPVMDIK